MVVTGTHTSMLGSGSHIKLSIHITVIGPVGMNPSLQLRVTVTPGLSVPLETGLKTPFGVVSGGHPAEQ